jgi:hypothetical protein
VRNSFFASTTVMVVGTVTLLAQIRHWPNVTDDEFFGGMTMILGAFAYRLLKRRRLGLAPSAKWKPVAEILLLVLTFVPTALEATVKDGIGHSPLASIVIPAASIIAYLTARYRKVEPARDAGLDLSKV